MTKPFTRARACGHVPKPTKHARGIILSAVPRYTLDPTVMVEMFSRFRVRSTIIDFNG